MPRSVSHTTLKSSHGFHGFHEFICIGHARIEARPNDVVVFACILETARNTAFWQCLHKIREIREIRGSFFLLQDISLTTELNRYPEPIGA